jgi:hypothetical protein
MNVKKTPSGKFAFALQFEEREDLFMSLANFLESESVNVSFVKIKTDNDLNRHLKYAVLDSLIYRHMGKLCSKRKTEQLQLTRSEAIALVWLLRDTDKQILIDLKGALHQKLS